LYLAVTNSAVDNLKRKVKAANSNFSTITKFLLKNGNSDYDLLFIDECSTVSNLEMIEILNKANFKLLILVGDDYQIESIRFGNWFAIIRHFLSPECIFELKKPYRTKNEKLLNLWEKVRNLDSDILEHLVKEGYTKTLDQSIFSDIKEEDEIVLALNYDGFYGINNLNSILQANNKNQPVYWGDKIFKVGDPILFNETKRFGPAIYNNLKGKIVNIKVISDKIQKIQFDIEVYKSINELEIKDCELIKILQNGHSIIRFSVNKHKSTDEEDDESASDVIPFQIAYAVSIHKAQGLEYDSVKIVISSEVDELITHNIFYTAITRVREKLKIYWTPETEKKVLSKISKRDIGRDLSILKSKIGVKDAKP
jgi:ATP-dependent exoDNAse (exonuclease V) alpha subunit